MRSFKSGIQRELTQDALYELLDDLGFGGKKFELWVTPWREKEALVLQRAAEPTREIDIRLLRGERGNFWFIVTDDGRLGVSLGDNAQKPPF